MPTVTPNSPDEFAQFDGEFGHVRHHRAMETAIEGLDTALNSTGTVSTVALIATRVGFGGGVPGTASTAALITGFYRTAGTVNVGIPSMSTTSAISTIVSMQSQMGNAIQPGTPIIASPQGALPAGVGAGDSYCLNTNSITFNFFSISGINATTTVAYHVFSIDTIA